MVDPIFQDAELQAKFESQGFVTIPFLSEEEVKKLLDVFWTLHPNLNNSGFQSSSFSNDFSYKKKVSDSITTIFQPHFEKIFKGYRALGSAFLYKQPDTHSILPIHQDWTLVDEEKYVAINIWVPLIDATPYNGSLYVLPGSHYGVVKALRCPTLPMFFTGFEQLMIDHSLPMSVKAGEAIVLNQSLVHYSPPNQSDSIRIAITSAVISAESKMNFHYCADTTKNEVELFEMEDDFLIRFENFFESIFKRPIIGKSMGTKAYKPPVFNESELKDLLVLMKKRAGIPTIPNQATNNIKSTLVNPNTPPIEQHKKSFLDRIASFFQHKAKQA
jgi:hypothetical protein